jgi:hypothetical protein
MHIATLLVHSLISNYLKNRDIQTVLDIKWMMFFSTFLWNNFCQYIFNELSVLSLHIKYKLKAIPVQTWIGPYGSRRLRLPEFLDNWHVKAARFSYLHTSHLYTQELFLVLISVRAWVYSRAIVWPEGWSQWKIKWSHQESNLWPSSL